ncbi:MAG: 50S ribosomal protein L24 [Quinella sp. 3Q1]|nr:50S ribosomal protein L24 [Quinella sp. 3Q1]
MSLIKLHVKKGDTVVVLSGKDKGKQGKIISAMPRAGKVIVEGVNKVKRHSKPSLKVPQGGIITKEMPLHACKVQLICPACNKPTRIGHKDVNGKNSRVCKKCGEVIE